MQTHIIESAKASFSASARKLEQISANYRRRLQAERADISGKFDNTQAGVRKGNRAGRWSGATQVCGLKKIKVISDSEQEN